MLDIINDKEFLNLSFEEQRLLVLEELNKELMRRAEVCAVKDAKEETTNCGLFKAINRTHFDEAYNYEIFAILLEALSIMENKQINLKMAQNFVQTPKGDYLRIGNHPIMKYNNKGELVEIEYSYRITNQNMALAVMDTIEKRIPAIKKELASRAYVLKK